MTLFIIEDDPWYAQLLSHHLSVNPDYDVHVFNTGQECLKHLDLSPDLVCLDYGLEDMSGLELLQKIKDWDFEIPVIVVSGQEDIAVAVELLKQGAVDYILKDDHTKDLLWNALNRLKDRLEMRSTINRLTSELSSKFDFKKTIISGSDSMLSVYKLMEKAAESTVNVSISGETGTGKDLVAKAIHYNSMRQSKPFVAVNMAAIPSELIESELFGFEKGAFTGAIKRRKGKFEEANGGTLFLDEIGDLSLSVQSALLRVLQERELTRVGGNAVIKLNVRLIVATHKNLAQEVDDGNFRDDLYFRIMGLPISIPPLRDRNGDIILLSNHFLAEISKSNGTKRKHLSKAAERSLLSYSYPGNVRELRSIIEVAEAISEKDEILPHDLLFKSKETRFSVLNEDKTLREYMREIIKNYLEQNNYDVLKVAKSLDIGKSTIYKMIQDKEIILNQV
jgi:DNA-binding NtrC family response regulator